jgi:hypothetical protein
MGYEQIEAVPSCRYDDPSAKSPRAVPPGEQDDSYINQRLEEV